MKRINNLPLRFLAKRLFRRQREAIVVQCIANTGKKLNGKRRVSAGIRGYGKERETGPLVPFAVAAARGKPPSTLPMPMGTRSSLRDHRVAVDARYVGARDPASILIQVPKASAESTHACGVGQLRG